MSPHCLGRPSGPKRGLSAQILVSESTKCTRVGALVTQGACARGERSDPARSTELPRLESTLD